MLTAVSTTPPSQTAFAQGSGEAVPVEWGVASLSELDMWCKQSGALLSASLLDLDSGRTAGINVATPLNPASNMKLITTALALERLGPAFTFRTAIFGTVQSDGTAPKLVLRGNGDPTLVEADLWRLANTLRNRGVRRVQLLLIDQTAFDDQYVPPAYEQQPNEWASFRAPISAIAVDRNAVTLNVLPQTQGAPARVWFEPNGIAEVHGAVQTTEQGTGQDIRLTLSPTPDSHLLAELGGHVAVGLPRQRFTKRLDDPRLAPGHVLARSLADLGVVVDAVQQGVVRDLPLLTYVTSPPLNEILSELGKHSDNFSAEMLFKSLSATPNGVATFRASSTAAEDWLRTRMQVAPGSVIRNGSGLFDANRISSSTLVTVLRDAYSDPSRRVPMLSQLSVAGIDGTLANRFSSPDLKGRILAKTGTLNDAIALSGYLLRAGNRPPVVFSLLLNGVAGKHPEARRRLDAVVSELARSYP